MNLAGVPNVGPVRVVINTTHPSFGNGSKLAWAAGHEMAHAVLGYKDEKFNGQKGYKYGTEMQRDSFEHFPYPQTLSNPDHLTDFSQ